MHRDLFLSQPSNTLFCRFALMYCASVSVPMTGFSHVVHQYFISSRQLVVQNLESMWVHLKSSIPFSSQGVQFTRKIMCVDPMRLKTFINCLCGQFSFATEPIIFLVKKQNKNMQNCHCKCVQNKHLCCSTQILHPCTPFC